MKQGICAVLMAVAGGWVWNCARAQETNACLLPPQTRLEAFETNTDTVIITATAPMGAVAANAGALSVKCREVTDASTGRREYGVVIGTSEGESAEDRALLDYEELEPLLGALDYLNRVGWSVTSLPGFDARYTTKGGFRVAAFGSRRTGSIEFAARNTRSGRAPLVLSREQITQLRSLIEQAKTKLDELRRG